MSPTDLLGNWGRAETVLALYGLSAPESPAFLYDFNGDTLRALETLDGHSDCWVSRFCRNPLHPGPCKGWKKKLGQVAPGVLKMLEEERKAKAAKKAAAKAAAVKKAAKAVDAAERGVDVDAHPAAKKKMAAKAVAKILNTDEKVAEGAKLNQKEMAWHAQKKASQLLASNMAAGNLKTKAAQQKYKRYAQKEILAALKKDAETGATGPDSEYQKTINKLAQAQATGHADKYAKIDGANENDDELHVAVAEAFEKAIKKDAADQKQQGDDPGNVKALTKKLDELPGEPGSPEKKAAVAQAMGVTLKKAKPFNAGPDKPEAAPGGMTPAQAKKFGSSWGKVAQIIGVPKEQWPALKAKAEAVALKGGDPYQDPVIQKAITDAAAKLAGKATWYSYQWDNSAGPFLAEKFAEEIVALTKKGTTKPEPGSLLDLANQYKTKKLSIHAYQQALEKALPDLPTKAKASQTAKMTEAELDAKIAKVNAESAKKAAAKQSVNAMSPDAPSGTSVNAPVGTGVPKSKVDQALDDAFGPPTPAATKAGGAGAGGSTPGKKAGDALQQLHGDVYGTGPDSGDPGAAAADLEDGLDKPGVSDAAKDSLMSNTSGALSEGLVDALDPDDDLTMDEKVAMDKAFEPMFKQALETGDPTNAKKMIKSFKAMGKPQLKAMAKAMAQNEKENEAKAAGALSAPPAPTPILTTTQPQVQAAKIVSALGGVATVLDPTNGPKHAEMLGKQEKLLATNIESGKIDPVAQVKKVAKQMAAATIKKKSDQLPAGQQMSSVEQAVMAEKMAAAIINQVVTGVEDPMLASYVDMTPQSMKKIAGGYVKMKPPVNSLADAGPDPLDALDDDLAKALGAPPLKAQADVDAFSPSPAAPSMADVGKVPDALFANAGLNPKIYSGMAAQYHLAIQNGDADSAAEALEGMSTALAKKFAQTHMDGYGFYTPEEQALAGEVLTKLVKDYQDAIIAGADEPGGLATALPAIVDEINKDAKKLAADNGWPENSPAIDSFKGSKLLLLSGAASGNLDLYHTKPPTVKTTPNGGSGGKAPATVAPLAAPAASTTPAKAAKKTTAAKKTAAKKAPAKKAAPTKAAVAAAKGQKITAKMHGAQVVVDGPVNKIPKQAPVSAPVAQMGQTIHPPEGIYPISQVIVDGNEQEVADYNAAVNAGASGKEAGNVPRNFSELTGAQRDAVYDYTTNPGYDKLNGFLRPPNPGDASENPGPSGKHSASAADQVAHIDAAMNESRLTQPITTLRGFRGSERAFGALWTQHRDQSWAGAEFRDLAYGSTSINMGTARGFAGAGGPDAVILRIHMPVGTRAINLVGKGAYGHEAEILLNRGARFRIVADNGYQNGARHLDVEVICDADDCAE